MDVAGDLLDIELSPDDELRKAPKLSPREARALDALERRTNGYLMTTRPLASTRTVGDPLPTLPSNPFLPADEPDTTLGELARWERPRTDPPDLEEALQKYRHAQIEAALKRYRPSDVADLDDRRAQAATAFARGELDLVSYQAATKALDEEFEAERARREAAASEPKEDTGPWLDIPPDPATILRHALQAGIPTEIDFDPKTGRFYSLDEYTWGGHQPHPRFICVKPGDEDDPRFVERHKWRESGSKRLNDSQLDELPPIEAPRCPLSHCSAQGEVLQVLSNGTGRCVGGHTVPLHRGHDRWHRPTWSTSRSVPDDTTTVRLPDGRTGAWAAGNLIVGG